MLVFGRKETTMTTKSLFGILTISLALSAQAQPPAFLTNGLVAYYPFNGNANDGSGNGNNGAVYGAVPATNRFGITNSAYLFNGSSSYIDFGSPAELAFAGDFTVTAWCLFSGGTTNPRILSYGGDFGYELYTDGTGTSRNFQFHTADTSGVGTTNPYSQNIWYSVVVTVQSGTAYMYVNGTAITSGTVPTPNYFYDFEMGEKSQNNSDYWGGLIDDVRLYDRALSSNEIQQLYAYESTPPPCSLTNGLVAYYPFNGNVNDASGNGNNATAEGNYSYSFNDPPFSGEIDITGTYSEGYDGGGYVALPSFSGTLSNAFTMSIWAKNEQFPILDYESYMILGVEQGSSPFAEIDLAGNTNVTGDPLDIGFVVGGGPNVRIDVTNFPSNFFQNWKHIVLSKDTNGISAYINGTLVGTTNVAFTFTPTSYNAIGRHTWDNGGDYSARLTASLSHARIYNRALSSNEVQQLYVYESGTNPPSICVQPQPVIVNAGSNASFTVTAYGSPPLNYQWLFNGTNISGATSSSLTISNVAQCNLGNYDVVVSNDFGSITSSNAVLSMYPFLETPFGGLVTDWGYTNILSVQAWGTGPLTYQWFDNGAAISNATNSTLTLSSIQFSNAGLYSVVVSSLYGSVTNTPEQVVVNPAGVSFGLYPGVTVTGTVGYTYNIQATRDLSNTNSWTNVATLTLELPVQLWMDTNVNTTLPGNPQRFYRVLPGQ